MGLKTEIGWCDSTVNPQMGCDGCELADCYARRLHERWGGRRAAAGRPGWPKAFDQPAVFPERLKQAAKWPDLTDTRRPEKPWLDLLPRLVFTCDLGDPFTESLPLDWMAPHLDLMASSPHRWLVLTKRPKRAREFFAHHPVPHNLWLGTTVTGPGTEGRLRDLLAIPALVHFASLEPLLGLPDIFPYLCGDPPIGPWAGERRAGLRWVICGGESGAKARPMDANWVRDIRGWCVTAGVPFFFKQWGGVRPGGNRTLDGREWSEMPRD